MNIPLTPVCFLRRAGEQYPDRTALVCGKERFTFREFGERVGGLAGALGDLGVHPGGYEVAVIPVPDEKWGEMPKALVARKPDSNPTEDELIEFARSRLPRYKVSKSVDFLDTLPKGRTGKILKKDLRKIYWKESGEQRHQVPTRG